MINRKSEINMIYEGHYVIVCSVLDGKCGKTNFMINSLTRVYCVRLFILNQYRISAISKSLKFTIDRKIRVFSPFNRGTA